MSGSYRYNPDDQQRIQYHEFPALLLNEPQKALKRIEALEEQLKGK